KSAIMSPRFEKKSTVPSQALERPSTNPSHKSPKKSPTPLQSQPSGFQPNPPLFPSCCSVGVNPLSSYSIELSPYTGENGSSSVNSSAKLIMYRILLPSVLRMLSPLLIAYDVNSCRCFDAGFRFRVNVPFTFTKQ